MTLQIFYLTDKSFVKYELYSTRICCLVHFQLPPGVPDICIPDDFTLYKCCHIPKNSQNSMAAEINAATLRVFLCGTQNIIDVH